ncbi:MAG: hypothetical protein MUC83_01040, partial [Pirellula sp.]|nr:hypothetical protein [Pirellula sp.]
MNNKLGMAIARILSTTRLLTTIGLVLFCLCQSTLETAFAQGPVAPPAPPVPAAPVPVPDPNAEVAETQFIPDYGDSLWNKTIEMPSGEISPETNKQPNPSFDVNIWSLSGALIRNNEMPTLAANPGKNFLVQLVVNYRTLEPTKLFANLKLDKLLTPEEAQKLMKFHSRTWHYDNQSSPGATAISSPGSQWITLIGTAPKEEGEYEFFIDVGLMPMQTGGLLKKLYKVKLVTKFEKPIPLNPTAVAIHSESKRVAVGEMNGTVRLLNAEDGSILQTWPLGNTQVQSLAFTESGTQLAVGFGGPIEDKSARSILVCSTTDGTKQTIMPGHNGNVNGLHFVKDGRLLSCGDDGQVMLWDAVSGQKIASHTVGGPARGLSYCESTNCACVVNNGGVRVDV